MRRWVARMGALALAGLGVACGGSTPSKPGGPGQGTGVLAGTVTSRVTRQPLAGIRVELVSGPEAAIASIACPRARSRCAPRGRDARP